MKRLLWVSLVVLVGAGPVAAQMGSQPSGFTSHFSEGTELAFYYPSDWYVADGDGNLAIMSRAALANQMDLDEPDLQPGDTVVIVGIIPTMLMAMMGVPVDDVDTILTGMFDTMIAQAGEIENGETAGHTFGARSVASVLFDDAQEEFSGMMLVAHEQEEVIVFAVAMGFREDLRRRREMVAEIISTVEFTGDLESMLMGQ
jgi:hypothetical protein